jgi:hypothetical protein
MDSPSLSLHPYSYFCGGTLKKDHPRESMNGIGGDLSTDKHSGLLAKILIKRQNNEYWIDRKY